MRTATCPGGQIAAKMVRQVDGLMGVVSVPAALAEDDRLAAVDHDALLHMPAHGT